MQDEITDLPGAPSVEFRMFSGYIDVGEGWGKEIQDGGLGVRGSWLDVLWG